MTTRRNFIRFGALLLTTTAVASLPAALGQSGAALAAPKVSNLAVQAAKAAFAGDYVSAGSLAQRSDDPAAIKLVELIYLRDKPNEAGYARIMAFLDAAPNWPLSESLLKRAERSLYANDEPAGLVLEHFGKRQPTTAEGSLAYARALLATGDREGARKYLLRAYLNAEIEASLEKKIVDEFGKMLTERDHERRMWQLVYAQESNAAIRAAKRLSGSYQKAAAVAQDLLRGKAGAEKSYAKLPAAMREKLGMKYVLARYYRRKESYGKARAILAGIPGDAATMGDTEAWWVERRIVARHSIGKSHRDTAKAGYQIARAHGESKGEVALEGEFLAGWIALALPARSRHRAEALHAAWARSRNRAPRRPAPVTGAAAPWRRWAGKATPRPSIPRPRSTRPSITDSWRARRSASARFPRRSRPAKPLPRRVPGSTRTRRSVLSRSWPRPAARPISTCSCGPSQTASRPWTR